MKRNGGLPKPPPIDISNVRRPRRKASPADKPYYVLAVVLLRVAVVLGLHVLRDLLQAQLVTGLSVLIEDALTGLLGLRSDHVGPCLLQL